MGKQLVSPYIHLKSSAQKEDEYQWYRDDCIESGDVAVDPEEFFLNQKFTEIQTKSYRYSAKEETIDCQKLTNKFINLQHSYIEMGLIAWEIKYKKLYRKQYKCFNEYCKEEMKLCIWQVNRIINASRIALLLIENGYDYIPTCESQARVLNPYTDEEILEYWSAICDKYEGREYELTATQIWIEIREMRIRDGEEVKESKWRNIRVRRELYHKLVREALANHQTLIEFIESFVFDYDQVEGRRLSDEEDKIISNLEEQWIRS